MLMITERLLRISLKTHQDKFQGLSVVFPEQSASILSKNYIFWTSHPLEGGGGREWALLPYRYFKIYEGKFVNLWEQKQIIITTVLIERFLAKNCVLRLWGQWTYHN